MNLQVFNEMLQRMPPSWVPMLQHTMGCAVCMPVLAQFGNLAVFQQRQPKLSGEQMFQKVSEKLCPIGRELATAMAVPIPATIPVVTRTQDELRDERRRAETMAIMAEVDNEP